MKVDLNKLSETITAPRTDAVYNCHSYLTKVPLAAIEPFIEAYTKPGDLVVDFFAGSGMTGLAALRLNRRAQLSDISVLGKHIATGYLTNVSAVELTKEAKKVMNKAKEAIGGLYLSKRVSDGAKVEVIRTVWSFSYVCPKCKLEMVYFEHLDKKGKPPKECVSCSEPFLRRNWRRGEDVPVEVVVLGENNRHIEQPVTDYDRKNIRVASNDPRKKDVPSLTIGSDREMYSRSALGKWDMAETGKFFSARNSIALIELWKAINRLKGNDVRKKLRFAFTAILPRASKRYQWSPKRPLNAQNQTYYVAPVYYEWNVFALFKRKVEAVIRAQDETFGRRTLFDAEEDDDIAYEITSAEKLCHLTNESADYVFTDPPFGSNIFYSDMNLFHEAWLGEVTDHGTEAVVHTTGKKKNGAEEKYENLLRKAFGEAWRVLKPGRYMSVVFGNSSGRIWGFVQRALRDAGFKSAPIHVGILDKGQRSVKGLNSGSEGVVTLDLILTVQKPEKDERAEEPRSLTIGDSTTLIQSAIKDLPAERTLNPSHVYVRVLKKAIEKHLALDDLHLSNVLIALRNAGYSVDRQTGLLF